MKKRVLLISYYFAPQNTIGAVRPTKFAKYLTKMGYEVTVICGVGMNGAQDPTLKRDLAELSDVHAVSEWNPLRAYQARKNRKAALAKEAKAKQPAAMAEGAAKQAEPPASKGFVHRLANGLYLFACVLSDKSFGRRVKRELRKLSGTYDVVFSSYAPISVHRAARAAKKSGLAKRWIADFRDEVNMSFGWQEGVRRRFMKMLRKDADLLCAVSDGVLNMMHLQDVGRVLSNGFDREDLRDVLVLPADKPPLLRIVYCGQFRMGRRNVENRDIKPFFSALRTLIEQGMCKAEELSLLYAGDEGEVFTAYASAFGLEARVMDFGRVSREQSLALQKSADILLMASLNVAGQTGILTGKLFEYMMMEKPIVCCMAGDLAGSELKQVLEATGLGICCEQAGGEAEQQALYQYLRELMARWKQGQGLLVSKNITEQSKYDYSRITEELAAWMKDVV
ncbi:MAG: hypothetical protein RR379_03515 [Clostridia bacterium]